MNVSRITHERKKLGISQEELANRIGVSQKSISKYERGTRRPTYETLTAMAKLFDVSIDYLLGTDSYSFENETRSISDVEYELVKLYRRFNCHEISDSTYCLLQEYFDSSIIITSNAEQKYLETFRLLNEDNQDILIGEAKKLLKQQRLEQKNASKVLQPAK